MDRMNDRLDALFADYREACPDPDGSAQFMPALWQRIEARRQESVSVFRRFAQFCVAGAVAAALLLAVLEPRDQSESLSTNASYVDLVDASRSSDFVAVPVDGDI